MEDGGLHGVDQEKDPCDPLDLCTCSTNYQADEWVPHNLQGVQLYPGSQHIAEGSMFGPCIHKVPEPARQMESG